MITKLFIAVILFFGQFPWAASLPQETPICYTTNEGRYEFCYKTRIDAENKEVWVVRDLKNGTEYLFAFQPATVDYIQLTGNEGYLLESQKQVGPTLQYEPRWTPDSDIRVCQINTDFHLMNLDQERTSNENDMTYVVVCKGSTALAVHYFDPSDSGIYQVVKRPAFVLDAYSHGVLDFSYSSMTYSYQPQTRIDFTFKLTTANGKTYYFFKDDGMGIWNGMDGAGYSAVLDGSYAGIGYINSDPHEFETCMGGFLVWPLLMGLLWFGMNLSRFFP